LVAGNHKTECNFYIPKSAPIFSRAHISQDIYYRVENTIIMSSGFGTGGGGLREKLEGSTVIDLLTVSVLVLDFFLLREAGTKGFGSADSLLTVSSSPEVIAAQLTGLLLVIYIGEAIIDSSSH